MVNAKQPKYPEHEKLQEVKAKLDAINNFLDWLTEERKEHVRLMVAYSYETDEEGGPIYRDDEGKIVKDWSPPNFFSPDYKQREKEGLERGISCRMVYNPGGKKYFDLRARREDLMAEYFGIDQKKLEAEKRAMLDECRKPNNG